jgi:hypothetical protein
MLGAIWTAIVPSLDAAAVPARVAPGVIPGSPVRFAAAPAAAGTVTARG